MRLWSSGSPFKRSLIKETDVEWRPYPADLLYLAVEKGDAQALADSDRRTWIWRKDARFAETAPPPPR